MKTYKVTLRSSGDSEHEIDFVHPLTQSRVRRRLKVDLFTAQITYRALEFILSNSAYHEAYMADSAKKKLMEDHLIKEFMDSIWPIIKDLFYKDQDYKRTLDIQDILNKSLPVPEDCSRIMIVGNYGTGKTSMIKHISGLNDNMNFPYVDVIMSTNYQCEYIMKKKTETPFKLGAVFLSREEVKHKLESSIDRAVEAKINIILENTQQSFKASQYSDEYRVINAFIQDPEYSFDIRSILGQYFNEDSSYKKQLNKIHSTNLWKIVYGFINDIAIDSIIMSRTLENLSSPSDIKKAREFMKASYYEYLREAVDDENSVYNCLLNYILLSVEYRVNSIIDSIVTGNAVHNICTTWDESSAVKWPLELNCEITDFSSREFDNFINILTSMRAQDFGNSLMSLVKGMRVEIPYNDAIDRNIQDKNIILIDTVGINPSFANNNILENSTNLILDNIDAVIIAQSSISSMNSGTQSLIKHLFNRIALDKIFIAYTHIDLLNRKDFLTGEEYPESEAYIDEQKQNFLLNIQKNTIGSLLEDRTLDYYELLNKLSRNTSFLSNLNIYKDKNYISINNFLLTILDNISIQKDHLYVQKESKELKLVEYDYKKLSIIFYNEIYKKYFHKQQDIYLNNPPNYKATETLVRNLSEGKTYLYSSTVLTPIDDLYSIIIDRLTPFILKPRILNIADKDKNRFTEQKLLDNLKELISENIRIHVQEKFTSKGMKVQWRELYLMAGTGADARRRERFIETLETIIPSMEHYLATEDIDNWIDTLEEIFNISICELEQMIKYKRKTD
jgi:hypothetical protein